MNKKKIALLITGLVVSSASITSCTSNNDTSNVPQQDVLRRAASERIENFDEGSYNNNYSDFPYTDSAIANEKNSGLTTDPYISNFDNNQNQMRTDMNSAGINESRDYLNDDRIINNEQGLNNNYSGTFDMNDNKDILNNELGLENGYISSTETKDDNNYNFNNNDTVGGFSSTTNTTDQNDMNNNTTSETPILENDTTNQNNVKQENNQMKKTPSEYSASQKATKSGGSITNYRTEGGSQGVGAEAQGTAKVSFRLSGEILNTITSKGNLSTILKAAANETIDEINGLPGVTGAKKQDLVVALKEIFAPSTEKAGADPYASYKPLQLSFRDQAGLVTAIDMNSIMFDSKDLIDENSFVVNPGAKASSQSSNVDLDPTIIGIKMIIKVSPEEVAKNGGLKTNTSYVFNGVNKKPEVDLNLDGNSAAVAPEDIKYLEGFNISNFKTAKQQSVIGASLKDGTSGIIYPATGQTAVSSITFDSIDDKLFLSVGDLIKEYDALPDKPADEGTGKPSKAVAIKSDLIDVTGTTIKFKTIKLSDVDSTISKIEVEDSRGDKYQASISLIDPNNEDAGKCLQINGLERSTQYTFVNIHITAKPGETQETKVLKLSLDNTGANNSKAIETATFSGPQVELGTVLPEDGSIPDVLLPNGLKIPVIKNDATALRYVFKVPNSEGLVGDLKINGLRGEEQSNVQKIEEKDSNGNPVANYYVVSLSKLIEDRDYGFLILETHYKDPEGRDLVERRALKDINVDKDGNVNDKFDNRTEKTPLAGLDAFNVRIIEDEKYMKITPRKVEIPVFIDDMHSKLLRVELEKSAQTLDVKFSFNNNVLLFEEVKPQTDEVYKVNFVYTGDDGKEKILSKYAKVKTPPVQAVDIKSAIINPGQTTANVKFDFYTDPKTSIKTVKVTTKNGKDIESTWDNSEKLLKLNGLEKETTYSGVKVLFTLENGQTATHVLDDFQTSRLGEIPEGPVANFVARVYEISLGREPELEGWKYWIKKLENKEITATEFIAENLMTQPEFVERELSKSQFVTTMYKLIVNRDPDADGQKYWERKYDEYKGMTTSLSDLRIRIAREMMNEPEFKELVTNLNLKY